MAPKLLTRSLIALPSFASNRIAVRKLVDGRPLFLLFFQMIYKYLKSP